MTTHTAPLDQTSPSETQLTVSWDPPDPRPGLGGVWDRFAGPGATRAENWIQVIGIAIVGGLMMALYADRIADGTAAWKAVVAAILAMDIAGGVITNATSAAKRWYHRPGQGRPAHLGFVALHATQIGVVAWLFADRPGVYFAVTHALLLATSIVVLWTPLYLQRAMALMLAAAAVPASLLFVGDALDPAVAWFTPLLFLKILVSHLTTEAPFRPADGLH